MIVAGFELTRMTRKPSSFRTLQACVPEWSNSLLRACALGAASSSCSYAAVAIARSLFRKGANFTASIAFEFASTNLVIELGILLWLLIGWQFTLAEFIGGLIMVAMLGTMF